MASIHQLRHHLIQHLPPELVDLILDFAEYWPHTTTTLSEPVRAFGPFTWAWTPAKRIDYAHLWCPQGPAYAHPWNRWGESRRENSFLLRCPPIGIEEPPPSRFDRLLRKSLPKPLSARVVSQRLMMRRERENSLGGWLAPRGSRPVRMIVFQTFYRQDFFGATHFDEGYRTRLFCDVGVKRGSVVAGRKASKTQQQQGSDDGSRYGEGTEQNHPVLYKPLELEHWFHERHYQSHYDVAVWRYDEKERDPPSSDVNFPTAQEFVKQLEIGDSIGVWARVGEGETYHIIDAMRMHVFWAV